MSTDAHPIGATRDGEPNYEAGVAGGMPLIQDKVGFRASVWYKQDGGWVDRVQPRVGSGPFTRHSIRRGSGGQLIDANANWTANDGRQGRPHRGRRTTGCGSRRRCSIRMSTSTIPATTT